MALLVSLLLWFLLLGWLATPWLSLAALLALIVLVAYHVDRAEHETHR